MKLDFAQIDNMAPSGLLDVLGVMQLIQHLMARIVPHIDHHAPSSAASVRVASILRRAVRYLRAAQAYNQHLRIRMWVLQSPARRAWVRDIIGERTIARWYKRYAVLSGAGLEPTKPEPKKPHRHNHPTGHKYRHKLFALPRLIANAFSTDVTKPHTNIQPSYFVTWQEIPPKRDTMTAHSPTRFWPYELYHAPQNEIRADYICTKQPPAPSDAIIIPKHLIERLSPRPPDIKNLSFPEVELAECNALRTRDPSGQASSRSSP